MVEKLKKSDRIDKPQDVQPFQRELSEQLSILDNVISNSYLSQLSKCEVLPTESRKNNCDVRWYRISKLVSEKDTFFTDRLSMLYMALHECAKSVILVINRKEMGDFELYIGARDLNNDTGDKFVSGDILMSGIQGFTPGDVKKGDLRPYERNSNNKEEKTHISCLSALASLRDDKKENFVQGIERLINASLDIPTFRAYFIAENITNEEAHSMIRGFNQIYTDLSPFSEMQIAFSESHTDSVSDSLSHSVANSISNNISETLTKGNSQSHATTNTQGSTDSFGANMGIQYAGVGVGANYNHTDQTSHAKTDTNLKSESIARMKGETKGRVDTVNKQKGVGESDTEGITHQFVKQNRQAKYYLDLIDNQVERLSNGIPFGLWSVASYFVAPLMTTSLKLANIYRGCIIGENSNLGCSCINFWEDEKDTSKLLEYLNRYEHPRFTFNGLNVSAGLPVTSKELAIHLSLPQFSVPGILVREEQRFGVSVTSKIAAKEGAKTIELGKILNRGEVRESGVEINVDSLCKHTFITGTTGSGKSNAMYLLLDKLHETGKKFLVIEPAKGEYKKIFGGKDDVKVYGSNPNFNQVLRINPFEFPDQIHIYEHIDNLVEIFNACWPMYAAMPVVLKKAITDAYKRCGWDLYSSKSEITDGFRFYPTVNDVVDALKDYINNSEYSAESKGNYKGALETRLVSMTEGLTGMMLNSPTKNLSDKELFENNVIVDLSRIGNIETKSLIMGLIVLRMNEYYKVSGKMNSELNHVTVIEEAHNLLKRTSTIQSQESSNIAGKSVEMICNSIAEMRTYGEGFIIVDQTPSQVDMAAIRNTNTKIIMSLPDAEDRIVAGKSIGLTDEQIEEIGKQSTGEAIVYQNEWEEAVQCQITKFDDSKIESYQGEKDEYDHNNLALLSEILRFLYLYGMGGEELIPGIKKVIAKCELSSAAKISLLSMVDKYNNHTPLDSDNRVKLMKLAAYCTGLITEAQRVVKVMDKIENVSESIVGILRQKYPNMTQGFYGFATRCLLRVLASRSDQNIELYNKFVKKYYGVYH